MIERIKYWLQDKIDMLEYKYGPERLELARSRIAAHELALAEGYQSPYTDPEDYDLNWRPIVKRKQTVDT